MTTVRMRAVAVLFLTLLVAAAAPAAAQLEQQFAVTSTLDGKTVLPQRIPWLAHPSLPSSQIKQVDFLIDGKVRWIEQKAPYSYGDDGEALVTSWLTPGEHSFAVRATASTGETAIDSVHARVLLAPAPPAALAGAWRRDVDTSSLGKLPPGIELPSGTYTLIFDKRWIQTRYPGAFVAGSGPDSSLHTGHGWIIDAAWTPGAATFRVQGSVSFRVFHDTDREGGFWGRPGLPATTYRWSVENGTLTLRAVGREPSRYRKTVWEGRWTRAR